jgi:23S rRNA (cytidine1920-2'-O)/16S rRNA (cytidine1409-2'-O)-methyltransferase
VAGRRRLDAELVRRGLSPSRTSAKDAIEAGHVLVNGAPAANAASQVAPSDAIVVTAPPPRFVSRGGEKLDAALGAFGLDVTARRVLDAGASTGGFTDCVLQRGARQVVALDVGRGQLHERLRGDDRVRVMERTNVRHVSADDIGGPVDLVVADLSFISLRTVIPALVSMCQPGADMVLLVKPQFEAGRAEASRGRGVITDPAIHARVRDEVATALRAAGCDVRGWVESPIRGADGNVEFLVHAVVGGRP